MKVTRSGVKGEVKMKAGSSVRQLASLMLLRIPLTVAVNHLAFEKVAERR